MLFSGAPPSHPPLLIFLDQNLQLMGRRKVTKADCPDLSKQSYLFPNYILSSTALAKKRFVHSLREPISKNKIIKLTLRKDFTHGFGQAPNLMGQLRPGEVK